MSFFRSTFLRVAVLLAATGAWPVSSWAIVANQVDTFSGTPSNPPTIADTQGWGIGRPVQAVGILVDDGASGMPGDHALLMDSNEYGGGRLLVQNESHWTGNWTAAGITRVTMDVRNANDFTLSMRLGIGGPGGISFSGSGDAFLTRTIIPVPPDDTWHSISFDVLPDDFTFVNEDFQNAAAALADIRHFRVIHAAEYSGNGFVDAGDYVVWRKQAGSMVTTGSGADGAGQFGPIPDGVVDAHDYDYWKSRFGSEIKDFPGAVVRGQIHLDNIHAVAVSGTASGASAVGVPEPASWLAITGLFVIAWANVRRRG